MQFFSWSEVGRFARIGLPVFIAQLAYTGMSVVDTVMTGQYSAEAMAAVAVAGSVWAPLAMLGLGCLLALPPLSAQMVGAGRAERAAHLLRQGLWVTLGLSFLLLVFLYWISWQLEFFSLTPQFASLAGAYLRAIMWGLPGMLLFINVRSFLEGFARTRPAMIVAILGLLLNVFCNYILIYGKWGFPALGAVGCGIASAIAYWFMALVMCCYICLAPQYAGLRPFFRPLLRPGTSPGGTQPWFDRKLILRVLRIGLPGAMALFFEVAMFACSGILLAPMGIIMVAGHQVATNVDSLLFTIPLTIGITVTIRVGYCLGAREVARARQVARTAMILCTVLSCIIACCTLTFRHRIVGLYTGDAEVMALAASLLCYQAVYQIVDGVQVTGIGILRGYNDTRIISIICFLAYCVIGLPLGFVLARTDLFCPALGAAGFWIAYIVALGFGALCYMARICFLYRHSRQELLQRVAR